jgi:hypothetical protein
MRFNKAPLLNSLMLAVALVTGGGAYAQQASFAVAITLHTAMKPLTASQLCPAGKPMDILAVAVRVECPTVANANSFNVLGSSARSSGQPSPPPEITVTF